MQKQTRPRRPNLAPPHRSLAQVQTLEGRILMSASVPKMHTTFDAVGTHGLSNAVTTYPTPPTSAVTPAMMRAYYGIDTIQYGNIPGDGRGMTIAIVDAYDQQKLQADFDAFNSFHHLPALTITKYNQTGGTSSLAPAAPLGDWGIETTLDVEWAHVIAPLANIIVVEGNSNGSDNNGNSNLFTAVQTAAGLPNVSIVSMSFGSGEFSSETSYDNIFTTPAGHTNVTFVSSTGDTGSPGGYPAYSPNVVAVGGTTFGFNASHNINGEFAWTGSGGGTSAQETRPTYQAGFQNTGQRTIPDVSMDASPSTGVAIYDSYDFGTTNSWAVYGGTSLAAPMFSGVLAITDQGRVQNSQSLLDGRSQTLPMLYGLGTADFHDIIAGVNSTSGSNGGFTPSVGYDQVTGRGSPVGSLLPNQLAGIAPSVPTIIDAISGDTITLTEDVNKLYIDWSTGSATGQLTNTNPAGLAITGTGNTTIQFSYANGNPVPTLLSLNGTFTLNGLMFGASPAAAPSATSTTTESVTNTGSSASTASTVGNNSQQTSDKHAARKKRNAVLHGDHLAASSK